jgi:5-methylthioadenosine/S-adenosylhomocysteine deaminase
MLRGGTTTIVDMYMFESVVAEECDRSGMRGILGQAMIDFPTPDFRNWGEMIEGARQLVQGYRGHSRIVPGIAPHSPYTVSPEHLQECHRLAEELECPLVIHVAETQAEHEQVLRERGQSPVRYLDSLGVLSKRLVAAHMVWPDDPEIAILAERGVGVGHCPQSNAKLASGIAPVVKMLKAGVAVGLGTDGCASNNDLDMWAEMQTANFLQKLAHNQPTVMSARETLELATINGARAAHLDHLIGSLEVGKRADMIVVGLDAMHQIPLYNPVSQLCYSTKSSDVQDVYVEGKLLVRQGQVLTIQEDELRQGVAEQSAKVRAVLQGSQP